MLVADPKIRRAIDQIMSIPDTDHHQYVLFPFEKYCVDKLVEQITKNPFYNLYLKTKIYNKMKS